MGSVLAGPFLPAESMLRPEHSSAESHMGKDHSAYKVSEVLGGGHRVTWAHQPLCTLLFFAIIPMCLFYEKYPCLHRELNSEGGNLGSRKNSQLAEGKGQKNKRILGDEHRG